MNRKGEAERERLQRSLDRLWEIYRGIGDRVNEVCSYRCPYKNREDRCTARFGCRNQRFADGPGQPALCVGSDSLDYRSAWDDG